MSTATKISPIVSGLQQELVGMEEVSSYFLSNYFPHAAAL